jgi:hypothetical protein
MRVKMTLLGFTIWVLCALIVIASLDAVPDPPIVNPQTVAAKAACLRELPASPHEDRWACEFFRASSHITWITLAWVHEPMRPSDRIALTGRAADPSPPTL